MKIAVLSGKGGTGKTFVSVNLAASIERCIYVDCDVEAPNGALFFKPKMLGSKEVTVAIPTFKLDQCTGCKQCVAFCAFHALAFVKQQPLLFPEVCHSCGGCKVVCPYNAIDEEEKRVGSVMKGISGTTAFVCGKMDVGQVSGVPIIKAILSQIKNEKNVIIDCPPGSGCMVMESIKDVDYCILVAEPTEFGRHNLEMVYELVKVFHKKFGVVLNKCTESDNPSERFCHEEHIEIIGRIPFDREIGKKNSEGEIAVYSNERAIAAFDAIRKRLEKKVRC